MNSCDYCGLLTGDASSLHPICADEVCEREAALSSCPDADPMCPACMFGEGDC